MLVPPRDNNFTPVDINSPSKTSSSQTPKKAIKKEENSNVSKLIEKFNALQNKNPSDFYKKKHTFIKEQQANSKLTKVLEKSSLQKHPSTESLSPSKKLASSHPPHLLSSPATLSTTTPKSPEALLALSPELAEMVKNDPSMAEMPKEDLEFIMKRHKAKLARLDKSKLERKFPGSNENQEAAIKIQKKFRGYLVQKHMLNSKLYRQCCILCEQTKGSSSELIPQASAGKTTVYLPLNQPIVLKESGRRAAAARFSTMKDVRNVLNAQRSTHLNVPRARLCGEFLVEERLPIAVDLFSNIELYVSYTHQFDEAVREMTRLFSKRVIDDLTTGWGEMRGLGVVRYDNLPLYLVEKNGKKEGCLGLIDLERTYRARATPEDLAHLVKFFPLHLEIIKSEAKKLNLPFDDQALNASAEKGKSYLKFYFSDHLTWLNKKDISQPTQLFEISAQDMTHIMRLVEKELPFAKDPKALSASLSSLILSDIKLKIEKQQKIQLSDLSETLKNADLIRLRSPQYALKEFYKCAIDELKLNELNFSKKLNSDEVTNIVQKIYAKILQELTKNDKLFSWDYIDDTRISIRY